MTDDPRYPIGKYSAPPAADADTIALWRTQIAECPAQLRAATAGLTDAQLDTPYRDGGWTVRQLVHHVVDSHLNAYCRFKLALTEDEPTIKPYLEDRWAELPDAKTLPVGPSLDMLATLHWRWGAVLEAMTPAQFERLLVHPEHGRSMSLWFLLGMYAWHGRHHVAHVTSLRTARGW